MDKTIMKIFDTALLGIASLGLVSCGATRLQAPAVSSDEPRKMDEGLIGGPVRGLPPAVVYRVDGSCADLVPVTLGADGALVSYPAPGDLSDTQRPLPLVGGWYLDRRGITDNSVLTTYTYSEYASMPSAPSPSELLRHISRECRITSIVQLPFAVSEAIADTVRVNNLIKDGFPGCEIVRMDRGK